MQTSECTTVLWALCACIVWHSISVEDNNFLAPASLYLMPWRKNASNFKQKVKLDFFQLEKFNLRGLKLGGWS